MERKCRKCEEVKKLEDFPKNVRCKGGRTSTCKVCTNTRQENSRRERYSKDPAFKIARKQSQQRNRAKKLGISAEELRYMLQRANGVCEICGNPPSMTGTSGQSLHIDHCHSSGRVRGMLCARCNLTLGKVEDSIDILTKMKEYLCTR